MKSCDKLRGECYRLNMEIPRQNLAICTFGNVSVMDRRAGVFAIKPSGVPYENLAVEDMVLVDIEGKVLEKGLKPSSDTPTHAVLYRAFESIGAVVHTHSTWATGWAQSLCPIPLYGTTHADHCPGDVPCTPLMADKSIEGDYEEQTGYQVVKHFQNLGLRENETEMVLVGGHGPFTWGETGEKAVYNAVVLEELAKMAAITHLVNPGTSRLKESLRRKHYERKHGPNAYYGQ